MRLPKKSFIVMPLSFESVSIVSDRAREVQPFSPSGQKQLVSGQQVRINANELQKLPSPFSFRQPPLVN
jgi:hypothetical protein